MTKLWIRKTVFLLLLTPFLSIGQTNTFPTTGNVGIGTTSPQEKLQIGDSYTFHDGGHKVLGFLYQPSGGIDLDNTKYAAEIRFDPVLGNFRFGTSSSITSNPVSRFTITKDGNVGVGTTSPSAKLEINDDATIGTGLVITGGGSGGTLAEFKRDIGATGSGLRIHANSNDPTLTFTNNTTNIFSLGVDGGSFKISDNATLGTNDRFVIKSDGNVGIGTTNPGSLLNIEDASGSNTVGAGVFKISANSHADHQFSFRLDNTNKDLHLDKVFGGVSGTPLTIKRSNGNVGIGTSTPDSKLTVKGNIHAEEVKVDLSVPGPDYVFNTDYKLTPLETLQQFINTNKHLPNIPSAKDMEANGIDLGVMNMKLLEKIEELTLYTLEQQKRIEEQSKIIKAIQQKLKI